jgi:pimeloyl-ACP methyl ester carboxylesterase
MPQTEDAVFYQLHFQQPGVAEAELEADVRLTIRGMLLQISGDAPTGQKGSGGFAMVPRKGGLRPPGWARALIAAAPLPGWLTEADIEAYAAEFARTGFRGGLNWYRNIDRNWELLRPFAGLKVQVPALYVAGERDLVLNFPGARETVARLQDWVPGLRETVILPGCGHWTQQERPAEVNAAMLGFLRSL